MTLPPELAAWRKQQRNDLLARREAMPHEQRRALEASVTRHLIAGFPCLAGRMVGFCWPYRAEPDPRFAVRHWRDRGARAALPVVVEKNAPLEFREWWPGVATQPGVFDLPVPQGTAVVDPDALLVPPVGFDAHGFRLGYGGGYFDRTLAAMAPQPIKIGVAFELERMPTIHPQPHDIALDFIVTEQGIHHVGLAGLAPVRDEAEVHAICARLLRERGLAAPAAPEHAMPRDELVALLNTLLEAERAGARVLNEFLRDHPDGSDAHTVLARVQRDEAANCAILIRLLRDLGAVPSEATGAFHGKALAVQGNAERLAFLNRGQAWVARTIREQLPRIADPAAHGALHAMDGSHRANIEACDRLLLAQSPPHDDV